MEDAELLRAYFSKPVRYVVLGYDVDWTLALVPHHFESHLSEAISYQLVRQKYMAAGFVDFTTNTENELPICYGEAPFCPEGFRYWPKVLKSRGLADSGMFHNMKTGGQF